MPVVLFSAPAGYGKSTLPALWAERDERPFAWVSLDPSDNDPVSFVRSVIAALDPLLHLRGARDALRTPEPPVEVDLLAALDEACVGGRRPLGDGDGRWRWIARRCRIPATGEPHRGGVTTMETTLRTGRLEAFSDGVFAIAVTLLVLEISVPADEGDDLLEAFLDQWPSYLAYLVSFATIGETWLRHTTITDYLHGVDTVFVRLNLLLLLLVSFLPFPTGLVAEHIHEEVAERTEPHSRKSGRSDADTGHQRRRRQRLALGTIAHDHDPLRPRPLSRGPSDHAAGLLTPRDAARQV